MEYFDEDVISAMHVKRREEYGNIEEGLYIQNSLTLFHKVLMFEDKLSVMMPNEFVIMLPELISTKYISEKKPDVIYTSLDGSVNFSFNLLVTSSGEKDMSYAINMLKTMIKNMNPAYIFFEDKTIESTAGNSISLMQFKSYGIDEAAYNIIYLISIDKYIIQGAFNCKYNDMDEWKRAAFEIIKSIKVE
ncbi:hypothetical protein J4O15_02490 [Lachnoanaerobaculum sp. Marseille-Q4761]|jgi:hypothetical protein|uniref:hypothetical protein n=1 Tax=Lachnoanaerobaculum sp. Marseille-Q4761 TaxID=2819511 RepID=UPI001AA15D28|nr:hypothetical protein [Lachnoanaerobaculum sp. Marseille-Q4761]MBO1869840.1 hypothetical protein [Lachnoanaerobaculum sp. Marseille-Q4761]